MARVKLIQFISILLEEIAVIEFWLRNAPAKFLFEFQIDRCGIKPAKCTLSAPYIAIVS